MLLAGWQEGHPACKKTEWWGAGMVICPEQGADLHMAKLMLPPLTVSCFSKLQIGFNFLVPAHPGSPIIRAVKRVLFQKTTCGIMPGRPCCHRTDSTESNQSTDPNQENHTTASS